MFHLFSDTSRTAAGSVLHEIQIGTPKLICYVSKILPPATTNHFITQLELLGLYVNISQFIYRLPNINFDCKIDHLA